MKKINTTDTKVSLQAWATCWTASCMNSHWTRNMAERQPSRQAVRGTEQWVHNTKIKRHAFNGLKRWTWSTTHDWKKHENQRNVLWHAWKHISANSPLIQSDNFLISIGHSTAEQQQVQRRDHSHLLSSDSTSAQLWTASHKSKEKWTSVVTEGATHTWQSWSRPLRQWWQRAQAQ